MSISPTFYEQLLHAQSPKAQKDGQLKQLFAVLGSAWVKAARKPVDEIDPRLKSETSVCAAAQKSKKNLQRKN